ncbi:MAG: serine/threonine-protein kinase [Deltaproteobacteria bacterium]|nr:serine/threonine-protein kinase [Deltaproteobacteria bacterium]
MSVAATGSPSRYRTLFELARGGMGRVDLAAREDVRFVRLFALKRLHPHLADDAGIREMFLDEARLAGLIHHPNVVGVVDVGQDQLGPFLVMDYIDGVPLSQLVAQGPLPVPAACRIAMQVAEGLHAAHELRDMHGNALGIIHRDVSPQNILVGFDGNARLTDFGVARAMDSGSQTRTGVLKGKLSYMAPERLRFEPFDRKADIYALGVVFWEMLSGRRLFGAAEGDETARKILNEGPPDIGMERDDVPSAVVELMFELLAKDPNLRPQTADDVARRLQTVLDAFVQEGENFDMAAFMEAGFAALKAVRNDQVRVALAASHSTEQTVPVRARSAHMRGVWALVGVLMLGLAVLFVIRANADRNEPAVLPTHASPPVPPPAANPPVAAPAVSAPKPPAEVVASPKVAKPATKTSKRSNRKTTEKLRLWQWR